MGVRLRLWGSVAVAVAVAALAVPVGTASAGAQRQITDAKYGFTFRLPAGWTPLALGSGDIQAMLNAALKNVPGIRSQLTTEVQQAVAKGMRDFAFGPLTKGFLTNLNVIGEKQVPWLAPGTLFPILRDTMKPQFESAGGVNVKATIVSSTLGTLLRVTYVLPVASTHMRVSGFQYYIAHRPYVVIVTISSLSAAYDASVAKTVLSTWRWR